MGEEAAVLIGGLITLYFHYYGGDDYLHQGGVALARLSQVCVYRQPSGKSGCELRGKDE